LRIASARRAAGVSMSSRHGAPLGDGVTQGAFALGMYVVGRATHSSARRRVWRRPGWTRRSSTGVLTAGHQGVGKPQASQRIEPLVSVGPHVGDLRHQRRSFSGTSGGRSRRPYMCSAGYVSTSRLVDKPALDVGRALRATALRHRLGTRGERRARPAPRDGQSGVVASAAWVSADRSVRDAAFRRGPVPAARISRAHRSWPLAQGAIHDFRRVASSASLTLDVNRALHRVDDDAKKIAVADETESARLPALPA